jgi:hypothetical protein
VIVRDAAGRSCHFPASILLVEGTATVTVTSGLLLHSMLFRSLPSKAFPLEANGN